MLHFGNKHENVIGCIDLIPPKSFEEFENIYIVMDCMRFFFIKITSADLKKVIKTQDISESSTQYFTYSLLKGLYFIHSANVIHRDMVNF
jgi:serine/threonine protein kinase